MFNLIWSTRTVKDAPENIINLLFEYNGKHYIEYYNKFTNKRYLNQLSDNVDLDSVYNKDLLYIEDDNEFKDLQILVYDINKFI